MKVYKRTDETTQPGRILSAGAEGFHETEYFPLEWKHLKNMFVFGTLEDAENCGFGSDTWECETREVRPAPPYILHSGWLDEDFGAFWSDPQEYARFSIHTQAVPEGTLLCDSLCLISRVRGR